MNARDIISEIANDHATGAWEGDDTPADLLKEWKNCRHAEVRPNGDLYIKDPQSGHYLGEEDAEEFVKWLSDQRHITLQIEYQVAFVMESGAWDILETFEASSDEEAEVYAEAEYPDSEWFVLRDGKNINAGGEG